MDKEKARRNLGRMKHRPERMEEMKKYKLHHTSLTRGYVSRKCPEGIKESYNGKFGTGYTIKKPNWKSTQYCYIEYWVEV